MVTDMQPGTPFVVRESGGHKLWRVSDNGRAYTGVCRLLQPGEVVHFAVWKKGDRLESRKTYVLRAGDAVWIDTGIKALNINRPPDPRWGYQELDETIHVNRFMSGPQWLREAL